MKNKYVSLILFLVISNVIFAQNYVKGYIIKNDNDSIIGLLDFKLDQQNSDFVRFKLSETASEQTFFPENILRYRFINEGKYYVSREITIDGMPRRAFLEYLIDGTMSLYFYKDLETSSEYYFFEDESGKMTAIEKKPDRITEYNEIREDNRYVGALNYLFQDYPTVRKKLTKGQSPMEYTKGNMIAVAKEYHKQTCAPGEECIVFENDYKKNYVDVRFAMYAGLQFTHLPPQEIAIDYLNPLFYPVTGAVNFFTPVIGGQIFILNPRWSRSFGLLVDIGISQIKGSSENFNVVRRTWGVTEFDFSAITTMGKLNLKYMYPNGKIRPVAEAGFSCFELFNSSSNRLVYERKFDDNYTLVKNEYTISGNSVSFGFNCGIGVDYMLKNNRSIFCRLSYDRLYTTQNYAYPAGIQAGQFKVGYVF